MVRKLAEELGRTQALAGEAHHAQQQWAEAQRSDESAFAHFASVELLGSFRPESLGRYAEACARQVPAPASCLEWLRPFVQREGPRSPRAQAISAHVPLAALGPLPPPAPRQRPVPTSALDAQAFAEAMDLYRARKFAQAASAFQALPEAYPASSHLLRARYWWGRSLARSGKSQEARQVFKSLVEDVPLTYYGLLAAVAAREDLQARIVSTLPKAPAPPRVDAVPQPGLRSKNDDLVDAHAGAAPARLLGLVEVRVRHAHQRAGFLAVLGPAHRAQAQ